MHLLHERLPGRGRAAGAGADGLPRLRAHNQREQANVGSPREWHHVDPHLPDAGVFVDALIDVWKNFRSGAAQKRDQSKPKS